MMASPPVPSSGPSDDRYRQALLASRIGTALLDLHGRVLEANPAAAPLLDVAGGQSALAAFHSDDRVALQSGIGTLLSGQPAPPPLCVRVLSREGGGDRWLQAHLALVRDPAGAPQCLLLQLVDDDAAARQAEAAHAAQHQLQLFADSVAHDLRAPLRSIDSFSALLAQRAGDGLDEAAHGYLARIRAAAGRMNGLLTALGELARATRSELRSDAVDLSLLAEWTAAELGEAEPGHAVALEVDPGLRVQGDERLLKCMLAQLLGNAWKFTRTTDAPRVVVRGIESGGMLRLEIHDNGCGFDPQYAHKLFQPFQRLHGVEQGGGHGLGLAIAQTIARRHGGRIEARSRVGEGCLVMIDLPAAGGGPADE